MTNPNPSPVPASGSDAARKIGCTCPLVETFIPWRDDYMYMYEIDSDCPIHGLGRLAVDPPPDLTLRPRPDAETGGAE